MTFDIPQARLLLAEVCPQDFTSGEPATYVRLHNLLDSTLALDGWLLEWDGVPLRFPPGAAVAGRTSCTVAFDAPTYQKYVTHLPDFTLTAHATLPSLTTVTTQPVSLRATDGSIRLLDPIGQVADVLAWGGAQGITGWTGPTCASLSVGSVYQRAIIEESLLDQNPGEYVAIVGQAEAWRQGTDWLPRRAPRVGQSAFPAPTLPATAVTAFVCPDSSFSTIAGFIDAATATLDINLYLFTQEALTAKISEAIQRQVKVRLLMEGEPYMGMPPNNRENLANLQAAGADIIILHRTTTHFDRYHFDHAKYAIADGNRCLIMSDNWTHGSVPDRSFSGQRGWGVVLDSVDLAAYLAQVFAFDRNLASPDCLVFDAQATYMKTTSSSDQSRVSAPLLNPYPAQHFTQLLSVTPVLAPEHGLLATRGICGLLRSATTRLDIQQQSVQLFWGFDAADSMATKPNLFLNELVAAARRGVQVRLLLDGGHLNHLDPRDNSHTMEYLRQLAQQEHLQIDVRILDQAAHMDIHNKGVIADGQHVLISSINWTQNSPLEDREMSLIIHDADLAAYFATIFDRDWGQAN